MASDEKSVWAVTILKKNVKLGKIPKSQILMMEIAPEPKHFSAHGRKHCSQQD